MARHKLPETDAAGSDSFLDITTNIVGILIILVMVVGERAKNTPVAVEPKPPSAELVAARAESRKLEQDVHQLSADMAVVQQELQARSIERGQLSTLVAAGQRELDERRESLDARSRVRFDLDRDLSAVREELTRVRAQEKQAVRAAAPKTIEIENRPTPLAKMIDGKAAFLHLTHGRLSVVPVERLMAGMQSELRSSLRRIYEQPEVIETVGPIEGFRLRYYIRRLGNRIVLPYVDLIPVSARLGEPIDEALQAESEFRDTLDGFSPRNYSIVVITFEDSFADYRELKNALHELGYSVATHPFRNGEPIRVSLGGGIAPAAQ